LFLGLIGVLQEGIPARAGTHPAPTTLLRIISDIRPKVRLVGADWADLELTAVTLENHTRQTTVEELVETAEHFHVLAAPRIAVVVLEFSAVQSPELTIGTSAVLVLYRRALAVRRSHSSPTLADSFSRLEPTSGARSSDPSAGRAAARRPLPSR